MITVGGLQKSTLIDFPGRVAATIFLCKCNFRCPWCYSRELVLPEEIKKHPKISEEELFSFLKERQGLLEGIVVCGGEPTVNQDLPEFLKKIKDMGYQIKIDTNGSNPERLSQLIKDKLVDYVAMDIKSAKEDYESAVRAEVDVNKIEESIRLLKNSGVDYEFRTTVVPGIHTKEKIIALARWISPAKKYYLQNFRAQKTIDPEFEKIKPYHIEYLEDIKKDIDSFFEVCEVR
ncbi:MAG: anaerobic ribonucleoside-triphosphate reductase activating protein [Candidatus Nealsonbacteria bacterium]